MSAVWYTSDTHFTHKHLALDIRGFNTVEDHDERLIENWNSNVASGDTVYHLGDFSLKKPEDFAPILARLNGDIHLIVGNHDRCFSGIRDAHRFQRAYYDAGFKSVQSYMRKKLDGVYFLMSHFPYSGDHGEDRYTQYRLRNEGLPIVHGHTHLDTVLSAHIMTPQIHVGVDAWHLNLVNQEKLLVILKEVSEYGVGV